MPQSIDTGLAEHSTLGSTAALVVNALEHYGLDYGAIFKAAGFDADYVLSSAERVPTSKLKKLWDLSAWYSGDPCFGLTYARFVQPAALHGLGFARLASHSL
jgi:hypothetical protein